MGDRQPAKRKKDRARKVRVVTLTVCTVLQGAVSLAELILLLVR